MEHMKIRYGGRSKWWRKRRKTENKYKVSGSKKMKIHNEEEEKWEGKRHGMSENEKMQRKRKTSV